MARPAPRRKLKSTQLGCPSHSPTRAIRQTSIPHQPTLSITNTCHHHHDRENIADRGMGSTGIPVGKLRAYVERLCSRSQFRSFFHRSLISLLLSFVIGVIY